MGGKSDLNTRMDRPESGGADKDMRLEKSGVLEREAEKFAVEDADKRDDAPAQDSQQPAPFTVGSPRNPDPNNK